MKRNIITISPALTDFFKAFCIARHDSETPLTQRDVNRLIIELEREVNQSLDAFNLESLAEYFDDEELMAKFELFLDDIADQYSGIRSIILMDPYCLCLILSGEEPHERTNH